MKTKLLPLLLLIVVAYANAQNVTIPNANFKNYLVNNSAINTNGDIEIQTSEAAAFTGGIDLTSAGGVLDLTGIEAFTNLTELRASGNDIVSVNLTQNTALEILYLDRNQLTTLDLSQNTNLITVDLERNQLTTIDVSLNLNLENLTIRRNDITTLNITQNVALKFLDTSLTLITTIDFSSNTLLETYWAQDSSLANLDLSQNTNVTYISAYNCNLTSANIANTNNTNMTNVLLYGNPNLTCIQIDAGFTPPSGYSGWSKDATATYSANCAAICSGNVYIPDVNFKNYLVNNSAINTNGDTEIQCTEAIAYTGAISVSNLNIQDLTGIEVFTEITGLQAFGNSSLTSIDVSQNTKITQLLIEQTGISGILDLSMLTVLVDFKAHTTAITAINMANGNNSNVTRFNVVNSTVDCVQIDAGFTPNSNWDIPPTGSFNVNCPALLSVDEFKFNAVSLYPNPTRSVLNIEMPQNLKQATIYNIVGTKVLQSTSKTLNTANLKSGMYLISIEDETGNIAIKRFIKQ